MGNVKFKQLGAILLLGGLALLGLTLNAKRTEGTLFVPEESAEGRVVDQFTTSAGRSIEPELRLRVVFAPTGSQRVIDRAVEEAFWNAHGKGSRVQVRWHQGKLEEARLVGATNDELMFWLKAGGGGFSMVLGLLALLYDRYRR